MFGHMCLFSALLHPRSSLPSHILHCLLTVQKFTVHHDLLEASCPLLMTVHMHRVTLQQTVHLR